MTSTNTGPAHSLLDRLRWVGFRFCERNPMYDKPHRTYEKQLELLRERGFEVENESACMRELKNCGYYNLSAYIYPFREIKPQAERTTSVNYRYDRAVEGATVDNAVALSHFDSKLRIVVLEAIEVLEKALRTKIAYHAGKVNAFSHLDPQFLDVELTRKKTDRQGVLVYERWIEHYSDLCSRAQNEDFFKHFSEKYEGRFPIWVAVEVMDFGAVTRLFEFVDAKSRSRISQEFGVRNGAVLVKWLKSMNFLRNKSAHHARLWNRSLLYAPAIPDRSQVGNYLEHLSTSAPGSKLYPYVAILAYLIRKVDPDTRWVNHFRETMRKFPKGNGLSPQNDMGFPANWESEELWRI